GTAGGAQLLQIRAVTVRELDEGDREHAHLGIPQPLQQMLFVRPSLCRAARHLDRDPLIPQHQPRIDVRREFLVGQQHDVAGLQGQGAGREVQTEAGVGGECDLRRVGIDQLRNSKACGGETGEQLPIREKVWRGAFGGEFVEGSAGAFGYWSDGGVVQIDRVGGPREFRRAERLERLAQRAHVRGMIGDFGHAIRPKPRTSSASRRPSPSRFSPSTARPIATPGAIETHGATRSKSRPSATIAPHDGVGGCAPRPMNDSAASAMIAPPMPSVAATITGAITLGSRWRAMIRASDAPRARAACTYSRPRVSSTWPRTMRAIPAQPTIPMTTNTTGSDGFTAAAMAISSSSDGNASVTSATRMIRPSSQRP